MNFKFLLVWLLGVSLGACGGGATDDGALTTQVSTPGAGSTLVLRLTDSAGTAITNNTIELGSATYLAQATLRESAAASGAPIPNRLVRFYTDSAFGTFINGTVVETATTTGTITTSQVTALTDSTGIAKAQLVGKKLGAATVWAEAAISLATATSTGLIRTPLDYQVKSATATVPINLLFSSAEPGRMVISTATSGTKTAVIQFRVVNELGVGVNGQAVQLSLDSQSIAAGVTFVNSADGSSSSGSQTIKTDFDGVAKITVRAGPLPTGVVVTATLVSNPTVKAGSVGLSVTSGRISQKSMSIFTPTPSVEAFDRDNVPAELTITAADRLGNPVPEGTVMNFITSHGLVGTFDKGTKTLVITTPGGTATTIVVPVVLDSKGSCTLDKSSTCKVQLLSSGQRPANGVVSLLAYADGEESFIDLNGNNVWDTGEPFTDMGMAYLDVNGNSFYDVGVDQSIPGGKTGSSACNGTDISIGDTCDGTWSDFIRVRQRYTVIWATSQARITNLGGRTATGFLFSVTDLHGNYMATGTTVVADIVSGGADCVVLGVSADFDSTVRGQYRAVLNGDASCLTAAFRVTVTSPSGYQTFQVFN